eukprot:gene31635-6829_t
MLDLTPLLQLPSLTTLSVELTGPEACTRTWKILAPVAHLLRRLDLGGSNSCGDGNKISVPHLRHLPSDSSTALQSISCVRLTGLPASPSLRELDLRHCSALSDLTPLSGCGNLQHSSLRELDLPHCSALSELTPLSACVDLQHSSLGELDLPHCSALSELTPLSACVDLQRLDISYCKQVTSLGPLSACTKLRVLKAEQCDGLTDLAPLELCTSLRELYISYCINIPTLKGLEHCTALEVLELEGCQKGDTTTQIEAGLPIEEIMAASKAGTLEVVKYPCISDLAPLATCTALRRLNLAWCYKVTDLAPLASCTSLTSLDVSHCALQGGKDIPSPLTPLVSLPCLRSLALGIGGFSQNNEQIWRPLMHRRENPLEEMFCGRVIWVRDASHPRAANLKCFYEGLLLPRNCNAVPCFRSGLHKVLPSFLIDLGQGYYRVPEGGTLPSARDPGKTAAVLLLGSPGSGKSLLGEAMRRANPSITFISVGTQLRAEGLVDEYTDNPTEARRLHMDQRAALILAQGLRQATWQSSPVVLECVKDLEGAYTLMATLQEHGIQLQRVLYLSSAAFNVSHLKHPLGNDYNSSVSEKRDKERRVEERQAKWSSQAGPLIEFFSALGVLEEVYSCQASANRCGTGKRALLASLELLLEESGTLASLGYATGRQNALWPECSGLQTLSMVSGALVTSRIERDQVLAAAEAATGLHNLLACLPVPLQSVNTLDEADGTRCLLIVTASRKSYFITRSGSAYAHPLSKSIGSSGSSLPLPPNTVLDEELLWAGLHGHRKGFFLAFDVLSSGGSKLWHLPLQQRLVALEGVLGLEEAEDSQLLRETCSLEAAAVSSSSIKGKSSPSGSLVQRPAYVSIAAPWCCLPQLVKKQQAPPAGSYTVTVLRKTHHSVSAEVLKQLEGSECPYPTDGLVFTPQAMPYVLGMSEMLYKWQPAAQVAVDLRYIGEWQVSSNYRRLTHMPNIELVQHGLHNHLTYECLPQVLRRELCNASGRARLQPFEQLYSTVLELVDSGAVECTVDADSELEILSYTQSIGPPQSEGAAMCRGLVLHVPSQTVVATPFVRFGELLPADADAQESGEFTLATMVSRFSGLATASIKVDGSLIIAFMWQGQLRTATRRRMHSEQAIWAKEWLLKHANMAELHPGWTYLFEAVYEQDTVVVNYSFDGLLLLGAFDPEGYELVDTAERQELAGKLGLMAVPCLHGSWEELVGRLARGTDLVAQTRGRQEQHTPLVGEGWVVCAADSSRHKMVQTAYKQVSTAAQHMHPLTVWDAVRFKCKSRAQLTCRLPRHLAREMHAILDALSDQYCIQSRKLCSMLAESRTWRYEATGGRPSPEADEEGLRRMASLSLAPDQDAACGPAPVSAPHQQCRVCGCSATFDEHGDRICFCDTSHGKGCQSSSNEEQPSAQPSWKHTKWYCNLSEAPSRVLSQYPHLCS